MLIKNIIREFKAWHIVRKTVKQNASKFRMMGFEIDWIGRLYTTIDIPDEILNMPIKTRKDRTLQNMVIDNYVKDSLSDVSELLNELWISDLIIFPDQYIRFQNTDTILLILSPERRYTKPWKIIAYLIFLSGIIAGLTFLIKYLITLF